MAISSDRLALLRAVLAEKGLSAPQDARIPRRPAGARTPLSAAQERLFFLELYEPGTALYNDGILVRVEGALDLARLARAALWVAQRHEILRTTFVLDGSGPEQRIHPEEPRGAPLRMVDLAGPGDPLERARALAREDARTPFDLARLPLWRLTPVRLAEDDWALVLTMHHILSDGASVGLFFDELSAFYESDATGREPRLEPLLQPLTVQFGDYAAWERARHAEARTEEHISYWKNVLGSLPGACDWREGGGRMCQRGAQVALTLEAESMKRMAELGRGAQVTSNQLLLAAWSVLLSAESGERDVCTGIASSLRQRRELAPLVGFFVQSLPLRLDLGGDPSFLELVRRVRAAAFEAHEHAEAPFDRITRAAGRDGGAPLLQTFFSHMKDAIRAPAFAGTRCAWEFVDTGCARFELALVLHETAQGVTGFLEHDLGIFTPAVAARLAQDYVRLVGAVLARPELRLSELSSLCAPRAAQRSRPTLSARPRRAVGG